jgi:hypothetical protein
VTWVPATPSARIHYDINRDLAADVLAVGLHLGSRIPVAKIG